MMLPAYATTLIGRDEVLDRIDALQTGGARVITLVGPAGVGKTRLAVASAARCTAALFCDLRAARVRDDVVDALLRAMRLAVDLSRVRGDVARRVGAWLRARGPVRVVLDNFEQLDAPSAALVDLWRNEAPDATFVVTSRHPLRIVGERLVDVAPLSLTALDDASESPSAALFLDRATLASGAPIALDDRARKTVSEVVRALDGLPLAIELAAARLEVMTLDELRARLTERFALLRLPGARGGVEHHDALWDALEWSWQLLSPAERDALSQSAVFADGLTLDAAEATLRLDGDVSALDALHALRQKSLLRVIPGAPSRYVFYESVRAFALRKRADAGDLDGVRARVDAHLLARATTWAAAARSPDARRALDRLDAERNNLLDVLRRAVDDAASTDRAHRALGAALALAPLLSTRGLASLHLATLDDALSIDGPDDALRAAALIARGLARRYQGRSDEARDDLTRAVSMARALGDARLEADALTRLGSIVALQGDLDGAEALHRAALSRFEAIGDTRGRGEIRSLLGATRVYRDGERARALDDFTEAAALLREAGDPFAEHVNLMRLASVLLELGSFDACEAALERLIASSDALGDAYVARMGRGYLAVLRHLQGRVDEARSLYLRAFETGRALLDPQFQSTYGAYLGMLLVELGDLDGARAALDEALTAIATARDPRVESFVRAVMALAEASSGRIDAARARLDETRALLATQTLADFPRIAAAVEAAIALADAGVAFERGARAPLTAALTHAEALCASLQALPSDEVRLAARALSAAIARWAPHASTWALSLDGRWFDPPTGERVSLANRPTLASLLAALAARRRDAPGEVMTVAALQAAGWPGERLPAKVASNRVHVALSTLRSMGLDALLRRQGDGYCIAADAAVRLFES